MLTGRVGYAWNRSLPYARGGGAVGETTYNLNGNTNGALALDTGITNVIAPGWVVGGGVEHALTNNWTHEFRV